MGAGWGVADSLLQFRVPDLGFLEGGNARVGIFPEREELFVGLVTADTDGSARGRAAITTSAAKAVLS
jgi:hypothetical protein